MLKNQIKSKNETTGRIGFILFTLIPITAVFIIDFDILNHKIIWFVALTVFTILVNQIMSKILRKKYPIITKETIDMLMNDNGFSPAIISRIITFAVSVFGAIILSTLMSPTEILPPIMFFLVGYIYFTMIQFRTL